MRQTVAFVTYEPIAMDVCHLTLYGYNYPVTVESLDLDFAR